MSVSGHAPSPALLLRPVLVVGRRVAGGEVADVEARGERRRVGGRRVGAALALVRRRRALAVLILGQGHVPAVDANNM